MPRCGGCHIPAWRWSPSICWPACSAGRFWPPRLWALSRPGLACGGVSPLTEYGSMVDVILLERVEKLGQMGQIVKVKPGFARNYLLPQQKAMRATKENM